MSGRLEKYTNQSSTVGVVGQRCVEFSPEPPADTPTPEPPADTPTTPENLVPRCIFTPIQTLVDEDGQCWVVAVQSQSNCYGDPPSLPYTIPCSEL